MQPLDPDTVLVLREWIEKADADLHVAEQMAAEAAVNLRVREIVGFHCQQAAEKYLKALLTRHQIEFSRTHDLQVLLEFVDRVDQAGRMRCVRGLAEPIRRQSPLSWRRA